MHSALENLSGPGKPLKPEAPDDNEIDGLLDVDERLVTDLIASTEAVCRAIQR
jgi:hypothetical protein